VRDAAVHGGTIVRGITGYALSAGGRAQDPPLPTITTVVAGDRRGSRASTAIAGVFMDGRTVSGSAVARNIGCGPERIAVLLLI
jgi:hypothetical protein